MSAEVVFVTIILSGMGGSFEIVGSWRKRGYSFNGHLESDGRKFWSSLTAGKKWGHIPTVTWREIATSIELIKTFRVKS